MAVLLLFSALIVVGLISGSHLPPQNIAASVDKSDSGLHLAISERMSHGESYYQAVSHEQPARGYPTRPFVAVREPTVAYATKLVGGAGHLALALAVFATAVILLTLVKLEASAPNRIAWWASGLILAFAAAPLLGPLFARNIFVLHEFWSGLLIVVALLFFNKSRWWIAIAAGLLAVLVRELALPVLVVMAFVEFRAGNRRKALSWSAAVVLFGAFWALHAHEVLTHTVASTAAGGQWLAFGGWPFLVDCVRFSSSMADLPVWIAAVVAPLALLGWLSRDDVFCNRVSLILIAYVAAYSVVGRPDNVYWGGEFILILLPGLAFAPNAILELAKGARRARSNRHETA